MSVEHASRQFLEKNKLEPESILVRTVRQSDWIGISEHNLIQLVRHMFDASRLELVSNRCSAYMLRIYVVCVCVVCGILWVIVIVVLCRDCWVCPISEASRVHHSDVVFGTALELHLGAGHKAETGAVHQSGIRYAICLQYIVCMHISVKYCVFLRYTYCIGNHLKEWAFVGHWGPAFPSPWFLSRWACSRSATRWAWRRLGMPKSRSAAYRDDSWQMQPHFAKSPNLMAMICEGQRAAADASWVRRACAQLPYSTSNGLAWSSLQIPRDMPGRNLCWKRLKRKLWRWWRSQDVLEYASQWLKYIRNSLNDGISMNLWISINNIQQLWIMTSRALH